MPGKGKLIRREDGAWDIYLNETACWRNVPGTVWEYTIGGYQVIKKWLSYREKAILGRGLKIEEAEYVTEMARRIKDVNDRVYELGQSGRLLYVTNGDLTDWAHAASGIPAYTVELPPIDELGGGFFNRTSDIEPIFRENLPAMLYLVEEAVLAYRPPVPSALDLRSLFFIKD